MHRWAAFLGDLFDPGYGAHWGYSGANGVLGGFDPSTLINNGDGTYSVGVVAPHGWKSDRRFSPLELYLAGFPDSLDQLPPIPVFINPQPINGNPNHFTADTLKYVNKQDIVAKYGVRNPAASQSQHTFRAAFIGVSDELLNPAGMAYLGVLSGTYAGTISTPIQNTVSFTDATAGIGQVDTTIIVRTQNISGRVITPAGLGLKSAIVTLIDAQNNQRKATTSSLGHYSFENVPFASGYTLTVSSKRYRFASRSLIVNENLTNVDFMGLE